MTTLSDSNDLLQQGIEAARAGEKDKARKLFEQVLETDDENVKAWMWLYRVVDTEDEKRICLTSILRIDPSNEKAQQALDKLDAKVQMSKADQEVIPGVTRRQMGLIGGGAVAVVVVILLLVVLISGSQRASQQHAEETAAAAAQLPTDLLNTQVVEQANATATAAQAAANATGTQMILSPPPTRTPNRPTLPPEFTDTPTITPTASLNLPAPSNVPGKIAAWSGRDVLSNGFLSIVVFQVSSGQATQVGTEIGRFPAIMPNGQRVIYTQYSPVTYDYSLVAVNVNGTQFESLADKFRGQPWINPDQASLSSDGNQLVFTAQDPDVATTQVYLYNLSSGGVLKLTPAKDKATYTYPMLSPDGTKVAVVRNDKDSATPGDDIVIIDIASKQQTSLTTDYTAFSEQSPHWSPDGQQIVFAAAKSTAPNDHDIIVMNASGSGGEQPILSLRDPSDDLYPIFSPDGKYIVFASTRGTGKFYNLFIYEFAADKLYQLTSFDGYNTFPGGWSAS